MEEVHSSPEVKGSTLGEGCLGGGLGGDPVLSSRAAAGWPGPERGGTGSVQENTSLSTFLYHRPNLPLLLPLASGHPKSPGTEVMLGSSKLRLWASEPRPRQLVSRCVSHCGVRRRVW